MSHEDLEVEGKVDASLERDVNWMEEVISKSLALVEESTAVVQLNTVE